jgi:hypothetical protein
VLGLVVLGLGASWSPSGWLELAAFAVIAGGMVSAPWRVSHRRGVVRAGVALFAIVVVGRAILASAGGTTSMPTLPAHTHSRWLGLLVDEQDASLLGLRVMVLWQWHLPAAERAKLLPAMHDAYVAMRESEGTTPSAVVDTLLGRQRPEAFDAVVIEPRDRTPRAAVVFLHGYAGNFTMQCWLMAEAARAIDAVTVCPSTRFEGDWWTRDGERTARAALAYVAERHITPVYLAGLSNGGIGASLLAARLAPSLAGLILVVGTSPGGSTGGLPTLVVQAESDTQVSAAGSRAFAARTGATYASFEGGHFVMMVRRAEVRDAIAAWLRRTRSGS